MHPELERLLRAYDDFRNAPKAQAQHFKDVYLAAIEDAAKRFRTTPDILDLAVSRKYLQIARQETKKPSALPPNA